MQLLLTRNIWLGYRNANKLKELQKNATSLLLFYDTIYLFDFEECIEQLQKNRIIEFIPGHNILPDYFSQYINNKDKFIIKKFDDPASDESLIKKLNALGLPRRNNILYRRF